MAKQWISPIAAQGSYSRQAHCDLPEGSYEREMGREGFFGPVSHFYHAHPPTQWTGIDGPLRPRAFDTNNLSAFDTSPMAAKMLLGNAHCQMRIWQLFEVQPQLFVNADGDDLLFVHQGAGQVFCDFGHLEYRDGDYILLPRGTQWRLEPSEPTTVLLIEATNNSYRLPDKGVLGPNALFDPAMLDRPVMDELFRAQQTEERWQVVVKRRNVASVITYPFNPLDAIGWKGDLSVVRINWRDMRPVMSHRYHLPPSVHTTFLCDRFVVCTFCPRPIETDPGALKVPFFHSNTDFDEVIFYHRGEFFSRDNIHPGMVTFHPSGFTHGPHPGAFKKAERATRKDTDEVALMIDTRDMLEVTSVAEEIEWGGYVSSWADTGTEKNS